jgi:hypothetical protein
MLVPRVSRFAPQGGIGSMRRREHQCAAGEGAPGGTTLRISGTIRSASAKQAAAGLRAAGAGAAVGRRFPGLGRSSLGYG